MNTRKKIPILIWILIGLAALAAAGWLAVGYVAADQLTVPTRLFDPRRTPDRYGMEYEQVDFTSRDGYTHLAGWYIPSETDQRAIVFVHGRNASRTAAYGGPPDENGGQPVPGRLLELCSALHQAGFSVFIFDLRGHGQSGEGRFSFGQYERQDVLAAIDWLKGRGYQPGKIGVMGLSLGSTAGLGAAIAEPAVGGLVLDSSFAELIPVVRAKWVAESGLPLIFLTSTHWMIRWRYGWDPQAVKPAEEIVQFTPRPIMIIHCQDDQMVPVSQFEQLKAAAPSAQTWLLPHCEHGQTYNADPAAFEEKVISFFDGSLK